MITDLDKVIKIVKESNVSVIIHDSKGEKYLNNILSELDYSYVDGDLKKINRDIVISNLIDVKSDFIVVNTMDIRIDSMMMMPNISKAKYISETISSIVDLYRNDYKIIVLSQSYAKLNNSPKVLAYDSISSVAHNKIIYISDYVVSILGDTVYEIKNKFY